MFTLMMMMMILTMTMMMTTMLASPQRLFQVDCSLLVADEGQAFSGQEVNNNINTKIINIANINLIVLIIKLVLKSSPWQRILFFFFIFVAVVGSKVLPPLLPRNKSNDARAIKIA